MHGFGKSALMYTYVYKNLRLFVSGVARIFRPEGHKGAGHFLLKSPWPQCSYATAVRSSYLTRLYSLVPVNISPWIRDGCRQALMTFQATYQYSVLSILYQF